ncbi:MAG: hypothetical protein Q7T07_18985 [Burkholderiaceae bacterium]|nr:hypothetical protein [Burkholderiaceae bacterium]
MDQTLVQSGFDIEIALGERYLQYLLLLALDAGTIPIQFTVDDPPHGPYTVILTVPDDIDRTYPPHPDADITPAPGAAAEFPSNQGFRVEVLFNDPHSADLKVTVRPWFTRTMPFLDHYPEYELFVKLGLQKEPDPEGHGIATAGLSIELVAAKLRGATMEDAALLARLKPHVDQTLDLGGLASGGRIDDIAMRKLALTSSAPAALNIYVNLMLRSGPAADHFLPARGNVLMGQNILPAGEDMVFATRKDLYGYMASDAWYRRAVPSGSGYDYPLHFKERDGTLLNITIASTTIQEGPNRLRITAKAEIEINNLPNPDVTLLIDIYGGVDSEGVMTWNSSSTAYQSGLLWDVVEVLAGGLVAAIVPIVGPIGALLIMGYTEDMIADAYIDDIAEKRLDATLLDIAPNRLTIFRKRWDPFYETQHQIGLRSGGTLITADGIAFWGRAVLTLTTKPTYDVVIRDTAHIADEAPTTLRYRVQDIDAYRELLEPKATAPATDRWAFTQHDPVGEPYLFQITVDEAIERIAQNRLIGAIPYTVERIEAPGKPANKLLVISRREYDEERSRLIDEHTNAVSPQIWADHEAGVRMQVLADFAALGLFPTSEEIEAAVAAGIQPFIKANVDAYLLGALPSDLDAALLPLLRLELAQTHFGKLQQDGILIIKYFDLVHVPGRQAYYYRDHYVAALENTPAKRVADNLHSKPRYRSTPEGPVFLDS